MDCLYLLVGSIRWEKREMMKRRKKIVLVEVELWLL